MKCPCCSQYVDDDRPLVWPAGNLLAFRDSLVVLRKKPALIAHALAKAMPREIPAAQLLAIVWRSHAPASAEKSLQVHINHLRSRLPKGLELVTVRGHGYAFRRS
jgi:DNA-binding response OmpR family regulator